MTDKGYQTDFQEIKQAVPAWAAAEKYGLQPNRAGMICCPFHQDKTPSMKLDGRFHCFGCGADGDAIDLTARLFGLGLKEAAQKLICDFSLTVTGTGKRQNTAVENKRTEGSGHPDQSQNRLQIQKRFDQWISRAFRVLLEYLSRLRRWKEQYAPRGPSEEWHPLFCEALLKESVVSYLLDILMDGTKPEQIRLFYDYRKEVEKIEERMGMC